MVNEDKKKRIAEIEQNMLLPDFWSNKDAAQNMISELQTIKDELEGVGKFDRSSATISIFAGAGGDDAEDWVRMLLEMYMKFAEKNNWQISFLNQNSNEQNGYRSLTIEISGKNVYGDLKYESGVHRLVRRSPFNSSGKRQTSFAMVEVLPEFNTKEIEIPEDEIRIEFTKSSGPGGQNVNKRETAVRVVHEPTGISAFVSSERSQAQNKEKALSMVYAKIYDLKEKQQVEKVADLSISKTTSAEWGSQIRSYTLHPYKLVKDHRNGVENSDVNGVLGGNIGEFIQSMKEYSD